MRWYWEKKKEPSRVDAIISGLEKLEIALAEPEAPWVTLEDCRWGLKHDAHLVLIVPELPVILHDGLVTWLNTLPGKKGVLAGETLLANRELDIFLAQKAREQTQQE